MMKRSPLPSTHPHPDPAVRFSTLLGIVLLSLSLLAQPTAAEIPRATQQALQKAAPEKLTIEILTVKTSNRVVDTRLVATAKVLAAEGSESGLKQGDTLSIIYTVPNRPDADASPLKVEKGKRYRAFLRKSGQKKDLYTPAASSGSFGKAPEKKP